MVGQIKVPAMGPKRYMAPSHVLDRRHFADRDGSASPVRPVTSETIFCLRGTCRRTPRMSSGVRILRLGMVSGGVVFPGLSKLLSQEDALGAPCLDTVIVALRRYALAGRSTASRDRRNATDGRHPSLRCQLTACYTGHQAGKR